MSFWNTSLMGMGQQKPANPYGTGTNANYANEFDNFFGKGVWGDKGMLDAQSQAGMTPESIAQRTQIVNSQPQGGSFGGVQNTPGAQGGLGAPGTGPWATMGVRSPWEGGGVSGASGGGLGGGAMAGASGSGMMGMGAGGANGPDWMAADRQQAIRNNYAQHGNDPAKISQLMREYGVSNDAFMRATGMDQGAFDNYMRPVFGGGQSGGGGQGGGMGGGMPTGPGRNPFTDNPFYSSMAGDIARRTQQSLGQSLNGIQSNAIGVGGLGGSRQGVAQGQAISGAMDNMSGQLAALGGGMWNSDQNRDLQRYQGDQNFYTAQRGQDYQGIGLGADLMSRGLQQQWAPINNANGVYNQYTGLGTTTGSQQSGGGWGGAIGGALGAGQFARNMGWW